MLVHVPRQVAEREGGLAGWLQRFGLFVVGVVLGAGWRVAIGG